MADHAEAGVLDVSSLSAPVASDPAASGPIANGQGQPGPAPTACNSCRRLKVTPASSPHHFQS
jgi:hypothetical protein